MDEPQNLVCSVVISKNKKKTFPSYTFSCMAVTLLAIPMAKHLG